jgi:hypothetical protein
VSLEAVHCTHTQTHTYTFLSFLLSFTHASSLLSIQKYIIKRVVCFDFSKEERENRREKERELTE